MSENVSLTAAQSEIMAKLQGVDMHFEILKNLPLVTLMIVQDVCPQWRVLTRSRRFKNIYRINQQNPQHLLFVMVKLDTGYQYYLIGDDDTFPREKVTLIAPEPLRSLTAIRLLNCVKGYQCLFGRLNDKTYRFVMWNPTDDAVLPVVFDIPIAKYKFIVVGCGICPGTDDIKLVKLCFKDFPSLDPKNVIVDVGVRTVGEPDWRVKQRRIFVARNMESAKVCIKGVLYFRTFQREYPQNEEERRSNFFKLFDFKSEEFVDEEVLLPDSYTKNFIQSTKVKGSLGLLEYHDGACHVWVKREGANWFTKMHTITDKVKGMGCFCAGDVLEFRKNGEVVVELRGWGGSKIGVYDPVSERITCDDVGIYGGHGTFFVKRYETTYH